MFATIIRIMTPIFILLAFVLSAFFIIKTTDKQQQQSAETSLPIVDVKTVTQKTVALNLSSYGVVTPKYKTQLVSEVQGRLFKISADFVAGAMVKKGQALAYIEPSDYQADLIQAEASLAQSLAAYDEEVARGKVAKMEFKDFNNGLPPELGLRLPQLKKEQANVEYAQATVDRAKRNLDRTTIRAPFDGIIRSRTLELGQYVTKGNNLGELYGTQVAEVRLPLSNDDLAYLDSADNPKTSVILTASVAGKKQAWNGIIIRSEGIIDPENRMLYLVAEVNDPYQLLTNKNLPSLKFGTFVDARIKGRTVNGIVKLPRYLVRNNQVSVINKDNTIEKRAVNIVRTDFESVYIKDSLKNNDRVSLTPIAHLKQGQTVKIIDINLPSSSQQHVERLATAGGVHE